MLLTSLLHALAAPPATVLEHTLDVRVDYGGRLATTQTWKVRIDDPAGCVAGLLAPPGLDGAMDDAGAIVLRDLLVVPETAAVGDVFTLVATGSEGAQPHSGLFETAPDLPTVRAEVVVTSLGRQPLTVWADPLGDPVWSTRRGKQATITWAELSPAQQARTVWSTWSDWLEAGEQLEADVTKKLATKVELGRDLAADVESSNLPELVRRTLAHVELDLTVTGDYATARTAGEVTRSRKGTAAERGLVILSMLRAAGYEAQPAMLRRATAKGAFPVTVPGPGMLDTPVVMARDRAGKTVWIDPSSDSVAVPALPAAMVGATVWAPGDLPSRRVAPGVVDGNVVLTTSAKIEANGDVVWSTDVSADGTGLEAIRSLLHTLDDDGQQKALRRLVEQGRPGLERFQATTAGTVDPFKKLTITLSGHDAGVFQAWGGGMKGEITPVLGAAMAGWLPPNIRVVEIVDITPMSTHTVAAHGRPGPAWDATAQIDRVVSRNGNRLRIDVDAIRPYAASTSTQDAGAATFLGERAKEGVEILLFPPADKNVVKGVQGLDLPDAEIRALQALLWWTVDDDRQARKLLKKALKTHPPLDFVDPFLERVGPDPRPWKALYELIPEEDKATKVALAHRLLEPHPAMALELSQPLQQHGDPKVAVPALLIAMEVAPTQEVRNSLAGRMESITDGGELQRARLMLAEFDIAHGQSAAKATEKLEPTSARARIVRLAPIAAGLPRAELRDRVAKLRSEDPTDVHVAAHGAHLLGAAGFRAEALDAALDAARLAHDDPRLWSEAARYAVKAGNLQLALEAAHRSSDLAPTGVEWAGQLHHLATLARDDAMETLARRRDPALKRGDWPPTLDDLTALAGQDELLAVLQFHEEEVAGNPVYLALRAQLRNDAGFRDEAARDSINLARVHGEPQGKALAFAATAGRVFGTGALSLLDDVDDPTARLVRLDYRLITGSGDARADARLLADEPRAQEILLAIGSPADAAAKVEGWPADLADERLRTPNGYRVNPVLSAARGVSAFSHADRQLAIVVVNGETDVLPPPLSALFSRADPPLDVTAEGAELFALRDGYLPLYAARRKADGHTTYGLGFTPEAARRALRDAP
ncbi:MAG: hypothetical protein H6734_22680 [Alphaproteobacteria bacterium]|nr:hypothetical protein [Alphaproteobacteria bacterium]